MDTTTPYIEQAIRPVCDALNRQKGIETLYSCQGHYRSARPFVIFATSQDEAFKISTLLFDAYTDGRLRYCWKITANFRDDGSLQYWLHPNDTRLEKPWRYLPVVRKSVDRELVKMARLLS